MEQNMFIRILNSEMELATGCTEPGAVALTAAEAGQALRKAGVDKAEEITVNASINIIKNAMSAGIPGTDYEGMDYAAAIGALGGDPVYLLEVMNHVPRETVEAAAALVKAGKVKVNVAQVPQKLYIEVIAKGGGHTGRAIVRDLHTNVVLVEQDGTATLDKQDADTAASGDSDVVTPEQIASFLTVRSIWDYCTKELDPMHDPIDIIRSAVRVNSVISDEGLSKEYGLAIGRNLDLNCRKGLMTRDLTTNSMIAAAAEAAWLQQLAAHLESGKPARSFDFDESDAEQQAVLHEMGLLSSKPVLYACNVGEDDLMEGIENNKYVPLVAARAKEEGARYIPICAKTEEDIADYTPEEKKAFLAEMGIEASGLDNLITASYDLLGLISFLTDGKKECRAWTIRKGTKAPQAAGKIHSDFERGFIRASVIGYSDLEANNFDYAAVKAKGLQRTEGKEYVVKDGDVIEFLFNV